MLLNKPKNKSLKKENNKLKVIKKYKKVPSAWNKTKERKIEKNIKTKETVALKKC